jgi:hypothetical protein
MLALPAGLQSLSKWARGPLYTCSKLGPETKCAMTRRHVSHGSRSRLPSREGSGPTTCYIALSPLHSLGRLRCRHMLSRYGVASPLGRASVQHMSSGPEHILPS